MNEKIQECEPITIVQTINDSNEQVDQEKMSGKTETENKSLDKTANDSDRNYVCGCGKSYLSYAALYTHAKTKHEGVFPEGTTAIHKKKQGRPKKEDWCIQNPNTEYQKSQDYNQEFQLFLDTIPGSKDESTPGKKKQVIFNRDIFSNEQVYITIYNNIQQIQVELNEIYGESYLQQLDIIMFDIQNARSLNCNQVLALFLIYIYRFVNQEFFNEICFLIIGYRQMANEIGWERLMVIDEQFVEQTDKEFCEANNGEILPDLANDFLLRYLEKYFQTSKIIKEVQNLKFFGIDTIKMLRVLLAIKHFAKWLLIHRFTKAAIEIEKD